MRARREDCHSAVASRPHDGQVSNPEQKASVKAPAFSLNDPAAISSTSSETSSIWKTSSVTSFAPLPLMTFILTLFFELIVAFAGMTGNAENLFQRPAENSHVSQPRVTAMC
jgi:hypothetical protein